MKSVLALSALSAATFLAGAVYAADAQTTKKTVEQTVTKTQTQTQTVQSAKAAPSAKAAQPAEAVKSVQTEPAVTAEAPVKTKHKKHRARKHHRKHHHHHHHRHHHHSYDHERHYAAAPTWNFLLGGSLGYAAQKEDFITRYTRPAPNSLVVAAGPLFANNAIMPIYVDQSKKITDQGVLFGLLAGWQWHYKRWMFGAEANVDFDSFEKDRQFAWTEATTNVPIYGTVLYDRGDIYAITGRAGYFVTPFFMPYLRLGAQLSRDEVSYQSFTGAVVTAGAPAPVGPAVGALGNFFPDYSSKTKDVYGIVAGIGAEFPTYIGASTIRFEYNFVKTESVIIDDHAFPVIGNHKFRYPESHIGKIAWVWNFM
jgi:hypothetical protein